MDGGAFPTLIAMITIFFTGTALTGPHSFFLPALFLSLLILLGIAMTLAVSALLSKTLLKGLPSAFVLELPPYRLPRFGKVILESLRSKALFVLARAVVTAAPAGLLIWCLGNISIDGVSLLTLFSDLLDPLGRLAGMDGVILMAFLLGWPANEIVLPIMIMGYLSAGSMTQLSDLSSLSLLLSQQGWSWITGLCVMLFFLFHFPCATTCLTIKKETGSLPWTIFAFLMPTAVGLCLCIACAFFCRLFTGI